MSDNCNLDLNLTKVCLIQNNRQLVLWIGYIQLLGTLNEVVLAQVVD